MLTSVKHATFFCYVNFTSYGSIRLCLQDSWTKFRFQILVSECTSFLFFFFFFFFFCSPWHLKLISVFWPFFFFCSATLDIVLSWKAWGSMQYTQIVRYILKFVVAAVWVIVMHVGYSRSVQNPTGLVRFSSSWATSWQSQPFYSFAIVIYLMPNLVAALLFMVPPLRRTVERSNWHVVLLLLWWAQASISHCFFYDYSGTIGIFLIYIFVSQPKLYVGRGMHEDFFSLMK